MEIAAHCARSHSLPTFQQNHLLMPVLVNNVIIVRHLRGKWLGIGWLVHTHSPSFRHADVDKRNLTKTQIRYPREESTRSGYGL